MFGFFLNSNITIAQNNSFSKAEVPTKLSHLQISPEIWKEIKDIKNTKSGRIAQIIDPVTILLKDKTIIRLASIDVPNDKDTDLSIRALDYLKTLLPEGKEIFIFQTRSSKSGRVNRMNHQLAHLVTKEDNIWVQGSMLEQGLAYIYTAPNHDELISEMIAAENKAIKAEKDIWSPTSKNKIISPENTEKAIGDFAIVEGSITKVASIRNNTYLNFGADWKTDFTIMIPSTLRKNFAKNGIDLLSLGNQRVRVRGWMREYNGPFIELEDISHLQILANPSTLPTDIKDPE